MFSTIHSLSSFAPSRLRGKLSINMQIYRLLFLLLLSSPFLSSCLRNIPDTPKKIMLHDNWTFSKSGSDSLYPAVVPGCVHLDLMHNGLIDDPFYSDNESRVQWVENEDWIYQTRFLAETRILEYRHIDLVFEGLDTYASVFLNDSLIISADNMFREWKANVKGILKSGHNDLKVVFRSPVKVNDGKAAAIPFRLPDERAFSRKAPYMFGWDWGPRLVTSGIWKPAYLEAWNQVKIANCQVVTDSLGADRARMHLMLNVFASDSMELDCRLKVSVSIRDTIAVRLKPGENNLRLDFTIDDPDLWWVHNLGDPFLYDFSVYLDNGEINLERQRGKFGIRTVELVHEPDKSGKSFYFRLNGEPVFMKGANYIPQDNFPSRVTELHCEKLIRSARDANMNMLRVWGGGLYEDDAFYDFCDQFGILVWQDFMFACSMYPGDSTFLANVREEAVEQVTSLQNHPCIALWCGNNEVDEGWHNWGWQKQFNYSDEDSAAIWRDYIRLFHEVLPEVVGKYGGAADYWPSSPKHGWGRRESLTDGDMHYWGVWWGREPFDVYNDKVGRFMSEYGFQGYPPFETLEQVIPEDKLFVGSSEMTSHQKHPFGEEVIRESMERWYPVPGQDDLEHYAYLSQLTQAYGIRTALEAHRRERPHCMGTLYWQLNDCWPVISWSGIDYYGRWKALHYFAKRAFSDILVCAAEEDGRMEFFLVNDLLEDIPGRAEISLVDFEGYVLRKDTFNITAAKNSSQMFFSVDLSTYLHGRDPAGVFARLVFHTGGDSLSENRYFFVPPRDLKLSSPSVEVEMVKKKGEIELALRTDHLVKDFYMTFEGCDGRFSDNFIDLVPGEVRRIRFYPEDRSAGPEKDMLRTIFLNDLIKN